MKNSQKITTAELFRNSLDKFLAKDMKGLSDFWAENVVAEFPFSPEGMQNRFEGKEAFYNYLKDYPSFIDVKSLPTLKVYSTNDPNVVISEWSVSGVVIGNGNPYEMSYATFVTFENDLIVNYKEYWNPQAFQKAMSGGSFES
jgi:ketosteroid isomerase-like protein